MKTLRLILILFIAQLALASAVMANSISGKVFYTTFDGLKETHTAIYPAKITALTFADNGDSVTYSTTNNSDGSYSIKDIKSGVYTIICEAQGYQKFILTKFPIILGSMPLDIEMDKVYSSSISGRVTFDKNGLPVDNAHILITLAKGSGFGISIYTDSQGYYSTDLPAGEYVVSCSKMDHGYFYSEYYDNVKSLAEAKVIVVSENSQIKNINFGLPDYTSQIHVVVKGTVKDDKGSVIPAALVKVWFRYVIDSLHISSPESFVRFVSTTTDAQGNYTIDLTKSAGMINWLVVSAEKENYLTEFYNNKAYFYQANAICITKDTVLTGIDFSLTPYGTPSSLSISGIVTGSSGQPIDGAFVVGARSRSGEINLAITDKDGKYTLTNLKEGKYYLLFAAQGYIPEFYNNAYRWEDAQAVNLTSSSIKGINAELKAIPNNPGKCLISGIIRELNGLAVSGALVIIKNSSGEVMSSAITDGTGSYEAAGLTDGNYTLSASKVDYQTATTNLTVDAANSSLVANLNMGQAATAVGAGDKKIIPSEIKLIGNYPNPFNPTTKISFSLPSSEFTTLKIYNMLGQEVATLVNGKLDAGIYNINFNAGNLTSGIYLYELRTGNYSSVMKMVLTK